MHCMNRCHPLNVKPLLTFWNMGQELEHESCVLRSVFRKYDLTVRDISDMRNTQILSGEFLSGNLFWNMEQKLVYGT